MPKRFKFRLSGVIPTFHFCRSKDPSDLPSDPFLSFLHHLSSLPPCLRNRSPAHSNWSKNGKWHVFDADDFVSLPRRKIYNSAASSGDEEDEPKSAVLAPLALPPPSAGAKGKRRPSRMRRKKNSSTAFRSRLSVSSADSGLFSDDEEEEELGAETETLVSNSNSSRSFSTDSSTEFSPHLETIREGTAIRPKKHKKKKKKKKIGGARSSRRWPAKAEDEEEYVAARLSAVFQRLVPCAAGGVEGKVRESLAVVKRSEEPYEDFKRSMVEMIVEKEMVEERDLQELLRCFLSLNSEEHHGIIIRAFDEICNALFISDKSECLIAE